MVKYHFRSRGRKYKYGGRMSEKGKDEDEFKRKTGRLQGYDGCGRARGGKRGTRMNVKAARPKGEAEELENGGKSGGEKRGRAAQRGKR